jgi:hypothetical protein
MVLAPLAVGPGAALPAAAGAYTPAWTPGVLLALGTVSIVAFRMRRHARRRQVGDEATAVARQACLSKSLRYQVNHLGYALDMVRSHYTPSFSSYLDRAQRNLVETYLHRRVWDYWVLKSIWGHLNFANLDAADRDNIMLTGYHGTQVNQYMLVSGDRRYAKPGSLTFRRNARTAYRHDAPTIVDSMRRDHATFNFCLFSCQPNRIYAVCNLYGMSALATHDAVCGAQYAATVLPRQRHQLDTEFTDRKGPLIPLRSPWLGFELPFYAGEADLACLANVFSPALATRLWAVGRRARGYCMAPDAESRLRLSIPPEVLTLLDSIDPGNYRRGALFACTAVAMYRREFGAEALAEAAQSSMDQDCGRVVRDGVANYTEQSGWANIWAVNARLTRTGDFRKS